MNELNILLNDLSGTILKKAELSKDFGETYSQIFKKILEIQITGKEDLLEVLGNVGG